MQNYTVSAGQAVKIVCPVSTSAEKAYVTWFKDGTKLPRNSTRVYKHERCSNWLFVRDVKPTDGGVYRCVAVAGHSALAATSHVTVTGETMFATATS